MSKVKRMQVTNHPRLIPTPIVATQKLEDLIDVFNGIASNFEMTSVGEPNHTKAENAFYTLTYDAYPMEGGKWKVISYRDNYSDITIRDDTGRKWGVYTSLTAYFDENLKILDRTMTSLARDICSGSRDWPQDNEKRTSIHKQVSWENSKDVYRFLRAYIKERLKTS